MKPITILAALLGLSLALPAAATGSAQPAQETLEYRAYVGGLPLGTLTLDIAADDASYSSRARFDMTALLRLVLDTDAKASATGRWRDGRALPESFEYWVRDGEKRRTSEMLFDASGDPVEVRADPPFRDKPYKMHIEQARGAVDPASAVAMLAAPRASACDLRISVFDGQKLHGIALQPESRREDNGLIYCAGRYERLAGFKAKYMTPERRSYEFVTELRKAGENRWRPTRVWAPTKFGVATAVLQ